MKRFFVLISFLLIVLVVFGMLGCATTSALTPLPEILNIINPDPSVGEIAKCSGIWKGRWDNTYFQATTVVLEKIDLTGVAAVYAWEAYRDSPGGWIRVSGRIVNNSTIVLEWGEKERRRVVTLTLVGNELKAEYRQANGYINRATLTKTP
ncbi:MAG: hypothetical protein ABII97_02455 [Patescibacteria group bacterium]